MKCLYCDWNGPIKGCIHGNLPTTLSPPYEYKKAYYCPRCGMGVVPNSNKSKRIWRNT